MEQTEFNTIKTEILERARKAEACTQQYGRAYKSETFQELCHVIKDNFWWACCHNVLTPDLIERCREDFAANDIYLNVDVRSGYLLAWDNATVRAYNNATVEAYNNATVRAYNNATVEASNNATVRASDNATVRAYNNATVKAYDNATVEASDNATVRAYNNATVEAYNNTYCTSYYEIECKVSDNAIYRILSKNEVRYASESLKFIKVEQQ